MGRAIFISYRRDDTEGEAGRLYDDLVRTFSENSVFMDVAGINPGMDFRRAIDDNVAGCGVLLAMIGPTWATISNNAGQRRLDDSNDFVRLEIASALARNIAVIPVLVHDARMPHTDQLPDNLKDLAYRNSVEITHARWNSDVQLLIGALAQYVGASKTTSEEPVHATVAIQLPPANPPAPEPAIAAKRSRMPLIAGISVAAVLIIAAIAFFASGGSGSSSDSSGGTAVPPAPTEKAKPVERPDASLAGTWTNSSPVKDNGLNKLEISIAGTDPSVSIHAWGKCEPVDCDWGDQEGSVKGQEVTATWSLPSNETRAKSRVATVTVQPDGDSLSVEIVNEFPNGTTVKKQFDFARAQ